MGLHAPSLLFFCDEFDSRIGSLMAQPIMRMTLCVLLFGITLFHSPPQGRGDLPQHTASAQVRLAEIDASTVPGLAYAVVESGEVSEIGVAGVKRLGNRAPIKADTPFLIGSISKSFTAVAVLQLVEAGQLSLEDPIAHHLPAFEGQPSAAITIRQLLSHTSGFSTYQGNTTPADASTVPAWQAGELWEYSNANYQILGRLIEAVSGVDFAAYVTRNILEPAGMLHSSVSDGELHTAMATGHRPWFGSRRAIRDTQTDRSSGPQGGVIASASDLARYMLLMMNGQDDIISAASKAEMMQPASDASPFYGLGWFLDEEDGTVFHSGASPGFESLLTMMPAEGRGVVVLVNAGSGTGFGETTLLRNSITASALGLSYTGESSRFWQKTTFLGIVLLPITFLLCMVWAWRHRHALRAKSGVACLFSLWFPLLTTLATAWIFLVMIPQFFGVSLARLSVYQPDLSLAMVSAAVTGPAWAALRLAIAYSGKTGPRT